MGFFTLSYGQTRTITLQWTVHDAAKKGAHGWHYAYLLQKQAGAQAALLVQAACDPALAQRASRGACGRGMDQSVLLHTARTKAPALQERHELALDLAIPFDVALRHGETGMAGELLHVSETAPDLGDFTRGPGNERPAAGVRRTAIHLQRGIEPMEPQAHGRR